MDSHKKKAIGKPLNELKTIAKNKLIQLSIKKDTNKNLSNDDIDPFLPPQNDTVGSLHPLRIIRNKIIKIFRKKIFNFFIKCLAIKKFEEFCRIS